MHAFGILEIALPLGDSAAEKAAEEPSAQLEVENQSLVGHMTGDGVMRFRFSPKAAKVYRFTIRNNVSALDGMKGEIMAVQPEPELAKRPSPRLPNWWTDDPAPRFAEGEHIGARTVSRWRQEFLRDFSERMDRCQSPLPLN